MERNHAALAPFNFPHDQQLYCFSLRKHPHPHSRSFLWFKWRALIQFCNFVWTASRVIIIISLSLHLFTFLIFIVFNLLFTCSVLFTKAPQTFENCRRRRCSCYYSVFRRGGGSPPTTRSPLPTQQYSGCELFVQSPFLSYELFS